MFLRSVSAEVAAGLSLTIILIKSSPSLKDSTQWCCTELSVHNLSQIHARHKNELMAMMRQCNAGLSKSADGNEAIRRCHLERDWCAFNQDLSGTHCRATEDSSAWPRGTAVMDRTTMPTLYTSKKLHMKSAVLPMHQAGITLQLVLFLAIRSSSTLLLQVVREARHKDEKN